MENNMVFGFEKKSRKQPRHRRIIDPFSYRQTIFLAGTGRSGTTWLEEMLTQSYKLRVMFEPFHSKKIERLKGWNYRQYLRIDNRDETFFKPAQAILSGNIRHEWIDKYNQRLISRKRLIKDIRASLFLKWIQHNFPEIPLILLLRHPCAVANSKLKCGWDTHLGDFLEQNELMSDFLNPFRNEIQNARDTFDKHIFMWCIENYIPLRQFNCSEICVVYYENLCVDPHLEMKRISKFIGGKFSSKNLSSSVTPSAMRREESAIVTGSDLLNTWRKDISANQIKRTLEICSIFGLQKLYNESSMPLLSEQKALNLFSN